MKLFLSGIALLISHLGTAHSHEDHAHEVPSAKAEEIRDKINKNQWEVRDIIDQEHLKSELREVVELQQKGELTPEEASVYLFRTHDFDNNEKLDGLELCTIFRHSIGDNATMDVIEKGVDHTLTMDKDNDGFITYPELKVRLEEDKVKREEKPKDQQ